jgi:hypothetical protein
LSSVSPDGDDPSYPLKFPNLSSIVIYCDQLTIFDRPEQYLEKALQGKWEFDENRYLIEETSA